MLKENQKLEKQIAALRARLQELPDGKIICARNGNRYKWYQSDGKRQIYIPKKDRDFAEQLAVKKYLSLQLEELLHEKKAIAFYLRHHQANGGRADALFNDMPEYKELLSSYLKPLSQELLDWMKSPYERNTKYPEQLIHKTSDGNLVRSKSESMIAMFLHINKIPYRYECALQLGETVIFPDFTIRHPETGELFYWEHFGLMGNSVYCKNVHSKLQLYTANEIIPNIQLITTYETKEKPLDTEWIEKNVEYYFL